jgi:L-ascorbate metabolism protein UlaG (beta-lactamase superfamily)
LPTPDVADVDIVLLSHAHLDHLHLPRCAGSARRPLLHPGRDRALLTSAGFADVTEVRVGDTVHLDGPLVSAEVVPPPTSTGRGPHSASRRRPVGYVVSGEGPAGLLSRRHRSVRRMATLSDIDVALLPIWGWGSSLGTGHLDPTRAATATQLIRPGIVVPIHWGTYAPEDGRRHLPRWFDSPPEQFETALADADLSHHLHLLEPGQSVTVP